MCYQTKTHTHKYKLLNTALQSLPEKVWMSKVGDEGGEEGEEGEEGFLSTHKFKDHLRFAIQALVAASSLPPSLPSSAMWAEKKYGRVKRGSVCVCV